MKSLDLGTEAMMQLDFVIRENIQWDLYSE